MSATCCATIYEQDPDAVRAWLTENGNMCPCAPVLLPSCDVPVCAADCAVGRPDCWEMNSKKLSREDTAGNQA